MYKAYLQGLLRYHITDSKYSGLALVSALPLWSHTRLYLPTRLPVKYMRLGSECRCAVISMEAQCPPNQHINGNSTLHRDKFLCCAFDLVPTRDHRFARLHLSSAPLDKSPHFQILRSSFQDVQKDVA
jgi:hypothetical protein